MKKLEKTHLEDIKHYGKFNELRMTGKHETSDLYTFTSGVGNRGASIRISK
jgi:glutamine synthetase